MDWKENIKSIFTKSEMKVEDLPIIPNSILRETNQIVYNKLSQLTEDQQYAYVSEFSFKRKSMLSAYAFWLIFGLHYAYVGKWGIQVLFWLTCGGFLIWWFIDIVRVPGLIHDYNADLGTKIMKDIVSIG